MNTITKKRIRISSPTSNSDNGNACSGKTLKSKTCYVCDGNDSWLLLCHGEDCPIAIHQSCISDEPDFDEFGSFYCPYCWYKRVVDKSLTLKKKLMVVDKSSKGLLMDKVSEHVSGGRRIASVSPSGSRREDGENVVGVNVSGRRGIASVSPSGSRREDGENVVQVNVPGGRGNTSVGPSGSRRGDVENVVEVNVSGGRRNTSVSPSENRREGVVEVNVSGSRRNTSVSPSGSRREGGEELYEIFVAMEKDQRMKEVVELSEAGADDADDADEGRGKRGRFSEKCDGTLAAGTSYGSEGRERRVICSERNHEKVQVGCSDVGEGRKQERRCGVNNETAHEHGFEVGVKTSKQRIYSEKNQKIKRVIRTHKRGVFINDERTDSELGEGRGGRGWCHENKQHGKASSTESCAQEVARTGIRVSHGSELGEGRHIKKSRYYRTVDTETRGKEVSTERIREGAVQRDGDESHLVENQDRLCHDDMRNDDATFNEQENDFRMNEQVERNYVSSSVSSPMSTDNVNDTNAASPELAMIIHPMAGLQRRPTRAEPIDARPPIKARPYSVSLKKPSLEKYGQTSHLEKNGSSSNDPGQRKLVSSSDRKRKRIFWTPEEEEMLKVGVEKFPGVRNIPWRKILEFGRDVFNCERVPSDLKDKWKNMHKMAVDDVKRVSLPTERQPNH